MKRLLPFLFALAPFAGHAQTTPGTAQPATYPRDATTGLIDYTEVVTVENASQAELYKRGKIWLASAFKSAKDVVQAEDKDAGFIIAKGVSQIVIKSVGMGTPQNLFYTLKINYKDGRYKYELTEFYITSQSGGSLPIERFVFPEYKAFAKINAQYGPQVADVAQRIIEGLKAGEAKSTDF
jgi:hypothetical protein